MLVVWRHNHLEEPRMTQDHDDTSTTDTTAAQDGQVSELAVAGGEPEAVSSGDSVAGQPEGESGEVQEGATGPNAIPGDETDEHPHRP